MNKTFVPSKTLIKKKWYIIDAKDKTLGKLTTEVVNLLRGKFKPYFTPYLDTGDYVIVINSKDVKVSGKKPNQKLYRRHSGRPGGLTTETFNELQNRLPNRIIEKSVKGMLPKGPLGRKLFQNLRVYESDSHCHQAQKPILIED